MRIHTPLLAAGVLAIATVAFAQQAPAPASAPSGVRLELHVDTPVVHENEVPHFTLRVVNGSSQTIRVSPPLDGSYEGWRDPHYTVEFLDANGTVVTQPLGAQGGRCGNMNPFESADVASVAPGHSLDVEHHARAFGFSDRVTASARSGTYQLRVRYRMTRPEATALSLVSNTAPITIAGGNTGVWECLRDLERRGRDTTDTTVHALRIVPWETGFALLYQQSVRTVTTGRESISSRPAVQRLDATLHPIGAPVVMPVNSASGEMVSLDDALLVVVGTDETAGERRTETFRPFVLRGAGNTLAIQTAGPPIGNISSVYHLTLVRDGDGAELFYFVRAPRADAYDPAATFVMQRFAHDGALAGSPVALTATPIAGAVVWSRTAHGQTLVMNVGGEAMRLITLDEHGTPVGAPRAIDPGLHGVPAGLRVDSNGYVLAYNRNVTTPEDRTSMGLYLQSLDANGMRTGTTTVLSTDAAGDPDWGEVRWLGATAIHANQTVRDGRTILRAGRVGASPATLSPAYAQGVAVGVLNDGFVVSWSDQRDDRSAPCQRAHDCESDAYAALLDANGAIRVGPSRLTSLLVSRATPASGWAEYCEASVHAP